MLKPGIIPLSPSESPMASPGADRALFSSTIANRQLAGLLVTAPDDAPAPAQPALSRVVRLGAQSRSRQRNAHGAAGALDARPLDTVDGLTIFLILPL